MLGRLAKKIAEFFSGIASRLRELPALLKNPAKRWRVILPAIVVVAIFGGSIYYYERIYLPSQKSAQPVLQTTVARRGSIVLSASGTGTLQAASQIALGFKSNGTLTRLNVKVGDSVKQGQVLAEQDNSSQQIQLQQARQTLAGQTSVSAIAAAQQSIATATKTLQTAQQHLAYVISPPVYFWEKEITKDEQGVKDAQAAVDAAPSDKAAQANLKTAQDALVNAKDKLVGAQASYEVTYVPNHFSYVTVNQSSGHAYKHYVPPSDVDILQARSAVTVAEGALKDAQSLYTALTSGNLPADASGTGLTTLGQAQLGVQTAQDNLQATQLVAPFSGTVIAVNANVGDSVGNSAVITLADLSKLYLETYVDESDYAKFTVGNVANVVFDALPDAKFTGKVVEVDPALNTSSGSAVVSGLVQLDPASADLLLGMGASVTVVAAESQSNAVLVPLAALHEYMTGKYAVFVMRNGNLTVQFVEVGLKDLVSAEIKSGLQVGDVVSTGLLATK
jgi:multidrug efflux pump subunit AcrA (membrane-fusion protein)